MERDFGALPERIPNQTAWVEDGMSGTPTLTVVIPTFNCAQYIDEAIQSVYRQSDAHVEIIVIDDGSTDGTPEVLSRYSSIPGIRTIRTDNRGLGPARNLGIELSQTDYIYFLDADDRVADTFIQTIRSVTTPDPAGHYPELICFSGTSFVDGDVSGAFFPDYQRQTTGHFVGRGAALEALDNSGSLFPNAYFYVSCRALWTRTGLRFKPIYHEDEEVIVQLLTSVASTVVLDASLYHRRIRPGSIMTSGLGPRSILGFSQIITTTLELLRSSDEVLMAHREFLKRRLFSFVVRYTELCAANKVSPSFSTIARPLFELKSVEATLRALGNSFRVWLRIS
jgi:glycosyltransferase involved in cell wall biosynthesis